MSDGARRDPGEDQLGLFGDESGKETEDPAGRTVPEADRSGRGLDSTAAWVLDRDAAARRRAQTEFVRPLLVEAGAGTGKTTTLTARILAWCLGPGWDRGSERVAGREAAARPLAPPAGPDPDAVAAEVLSRVVAITFTEAAVAEMASRMGTALSDLARAEPAPPWLQTDRLPDEPTRAARARALLGALDHLVVRTIHAFCRSLLATHPLEAGLHPELEVDPDGLRVEEIAREVVEDHLREAYGATEDPDLLALARDGIGPTELVEAVTACLGQENLRAEDLETSPFEPGRMRELREGLARAVRRFEEAAGERLDGLSRSKKTGEVLEAIRTSAREAEAVESAADEFEAFARLCSLLAEAWDDRLRDRLKAWGRGDFNRTESAALDDPAGTGAGAEPVAATAGPLLARIDSLRRLQPELLERGRRALAPMLAAARREMHLRGVVTFHDLLSEARDLLAHRPDVARRVRRRIDQLLVDELQDTDRLQVEIITAIALEGDATERPGLFLVGDPKQSIYGWRNADLRAYQALWERLREAGGEKLNLAENFRSVPAILDEVGRAVDPVMVEEPGIQPRFEPLVPCARLAEASGFARGRWAPVEYWVSWRPDEGDGAPALASTRAGDATRLEAEAIARDLARLRREEGLAGGQAALLLRSSSDLDDYLEALRREGVPFAVTGDRQYYRRREVIDAAALVRSVIDPGDHLALLTVLRSPAVGVPDAALIPLWQEGFPRAMTELAGPEPYEGGGLDGLGDIVARALERMPAAPPGAEAVPGLDRIDGWHRVLLATIDALARLRRSFACDPADRFVERLRTLVPMEPVASARHLGTYRLANLDRFFRRLAEAMESSAGDVTAILRALRRGVTEALEEEEGRPAPTGGQAGGVADAVQVMTIHKAKGLDFAHVYLPQLHKGAPSNRLPWVAAAELREGPEEARRVEYCLFGAPTPGYAAVEEERRRVEAAERVRTLYVAMTRAEERLVLAGAWPQTPRPRSPQEAGSYLDLLGSRFPSELDLGEVYAGLGGGLDAGAAWTDRIDHHRVRWVFPGLAEAEQRDHAPEAEQERPPALPAPEVVAAEARTLATLRDEAERRRWRGFGGAITAEARRGLERIDEEARRPPTASGQGVRAEPEPVPRPGADDRTARDAAMAAGTAVHRVLEELDLARVTEDPVAALTRERDRLPELLRSGLGEERAGRAQDTALELADTLVERIVLGPLPQRLERLAATPGAVLARELPVLLPPQDDAEGPLGYLAGAIDLVYRDPESGELVVADYKSDRVDKADEMAERAAAYAPQLRLYARALRQSLELEKPPRAELWFLWPGRIEVIDPE